MDQVVKPIYEVIERVVEVPITTIQDSPGLGVDGLRVEGHYLRVEGFKL